MSNVIDDLVNSINTLNNENGYNINLEWLFLQHGGSVLNEIDLNYEKYAFPWRGNNLYHIEVFLYWGESTEDEINAVYQLSFDLENEFDNYGWTRQYLNSPRWDVNYNEYDWKDTYYGYNTNQFIYNKLTSVKCRYDKDWFFTNCLPIPLICDSSDSSESSTDSSSSE